MSGERAGKTWTTGYKILRDHYRLIECRQLLRSRPLTVSGQSAWRLRGVG